MEELGSTVRANRSLDWANFFLADVRDGLGPHLAIYLLMERAWDEATIAGLIVVHGGYSAAFIALGCVAAIGAGIFFLAMPETLAGERAPGSSRNAARRREGVLAR